MARSRVANSLDAGLSGHPRRMRKRTGTSLAALGLASLLFSSRGAFADDAANHNNAGLALKREGKVPEAIAEVEKALAIRPKNAASHFPLGNQWRAKGLSKI